MIHRTQLHNEYSGNRKVAVKVRWFKARDAMRGFPWEAVILGVALVVLFALMSVR